MSGERNTDELRWTIGDPQFGALVLTIMFICFGGGCMVGCIAGADTGFGKGRDAARQEAIDAGLALWTINPETGERRFEYRRQE